MAAPARSEIPNRSNSLQVVLCAPNPHSCCHGIRHGEAFCHCRCDCEEDSMKYHVRLMDAWEDKAGDRKKIRLPTALVV
ncbi:hypothetical protein AVEN_161100-1 [Araneus ventricosus]|uniref:Uncharacterized protein n=1 Tax=Araneus ventricosus TaxID=182803 RepID=A0A4Y2DDB2_ARAVE|nr:hypothetical protein AVEN_4646-1 [Araneus ventricosus]GBM14768.1 hypothetical protein AVEN_261087-1 [Araneus ventricosus]GBM14773.1 hypothetical protein AVEN_272507-1 [Araneus ventricosus]GBM14813.1 hypothetical protein AVEN_161100-1 [Araneus ventricosus]